MEAERGREEAKSRNEYIQREHAIWRPRIEDAMSREVSEILNGNKPETMHRASLQTLEFRSFPQDAFNFIEEMIEQAYLSVTMEAHGHLEQQLPRSFADYMQRQSARDLRAVENYLNTYQQHRQIHVNRQRIFRLARRLGLQEPGELGPVPVEVAAIQPEVGVDRPFIPDRTARAYAALKMHFDSRITVKRAAEVNNVLPSSVYKLKHQLRTGTLLRSANYRNPQREHPARKYGQEVEARILNQLRAADGNLNLAQQQQLLLQQYGQFRTPSKSTIHRCLRRNRITWKKVNYCPPDRNSETTTERRRIFFHELLLALSRGRKIVSVDETGINCDAGYGRHYATAGEHWCSNPGRNRIQNVSCILGVSQNRVEQSLFVKGSCNSAIFSGFVYALIEADPEFRNQDHGARPLLMMDNAAIHQSKALRSWLASRGVEVLWCPPYNPYCNPVEFLNGALKRYLRNNVQPTR